MRSLPLTKGDTGVRAIPFRDRHATPEFLEAGYSVTVVIGGCCSFGKPWMHAGLRSPFGTFTSSTSRRMAIRSRWQVLLERHWAFFGRNGLMP